MATRVIELPEGGHYEGNIRDGKPHGQGVIIFPTGKRYGASSGTGCAFR